ncbi:MAG: HD domain-containing protein [Campylobacterales bacterium]|nr:HD domain-containing protein [Campylobacterales bacterium]
MTNLNIKKSYTLFDIASLEMGDVVPLDIYIKQSLSYIIIIEAGTMLSEKLYQLLQKQEAVYTLDELHMVDGIEEESEEEKHSIDCSVLLTTIKHEKNDFKKILKLLYEANNYIFDNFLHDKNNKIDLICVESIIHSIIFLLQKDEHYLKEVMPILQNDYKVAVHSFNVLLYAIHIGCRLNFSDIKLLELGKAALLHDVGKKKICDVVDKSGELSLEEIELTKEHSKYSVDILKENNIRDIVIVKAVMQHHERYDGSGYPDNLLQDEITDFASILAVCDVFDALTVYKPNRKRHTTFEALTIMLKDSSMRNKFNKAYIKLLLV